MGRFVEMLTSICLVMVCTAAAHHIAYVTILYERHITQLGRVARCEERTEELADDVRRLNDELAEFQRWRVKVTNAARGGWWVFKNELRK